MKRLGDLELNVLMTVVQAEIADMNAENLARENQGYSPAYDCYSSTNYDILCEQLEIIKKENNLK